jgi:DeoR family fructose operon transcriptional repressor
MSTYKEIEERRNNIYRLVAERESISIQELSTLFGVSVMTIQRDVSELEKKGEVKKLHGGVAIKRDDEIEPSYMIRSLHLKEEKQSIGQRAAAEISDGDVIYVDVGSTLLEFVRNIRRDIEITLITHWIPVVLACLNLEKVKVILLGGEVDLRELSLTGFHPEEALTNYYADRFFMGVAGISSESGLTDYKMEEILVKRKMLKSSKKAVVLADNSKFTKIAPIKICELHDVDEIITDKGIDKHMRVLIEKLGTKIVIA